MSEECFFCTLVSGARAVKLSVNCKTLLIVVVKGIIIRCVRKVLCVKLSSVIVVYMRFGYYFWLLFIK